MEPFELVLTLITLISYTSISTCSESWVSGISPREGSLAGGTLVTLSGNGFAESQFDFFNEGLGNRVTLVSTTRSFDCEIQENGCTETKITCYTGRMPADVYDVRVAVNSVDIPESKHCSGRLSNCRFEANTQNTPTITNIVPRTITPGAMVTLSGKIFSDLYGSNVAASSNGRNTHILRVYLGGNACELKDLDKDEFYGIHLNNGGDYGSMKCKVLGDQIGAMNASFILDGKFGRSKASLGMMHVNSVGDIEMVQSYAEITSIIPSEGSIEGGTEVLITGSNFDDSQGTPSVFIGGVECHILSLTINEIKCVTGSRAEQLKKYPGNRGVFVELQTNTPLGYNTLPQFSDEVVYPGSGLSSVTWFDELAWCNGGNGCTNPAPSMDNFATRTRTFFVPPWTGEYQFFIKSDDASQLYISLDMYASNKTLAASCKSATSNYNNADQKSPRMLLQKGQSYFMEVLHQDSTSSAHFNVALKFFDTLFLPTQTNQAHAEQQKLVVTSTVTYEEQTIQLNNLTSQAGVNEVQVVDVVTSDPQSSSFRLGHGGVFTAPMTIDASASDVQKALNSLAAVQDGSITVSSSGSRPNGHTYTVTFTTGGDVRVMMSLTDGNMSVSVTEQTKGQSSLETFTLTMGGIPSDPIPYNADRSQMEKGVKSIFQARCPKYITHHQSSLVAFYENFDQDNGVLHRDSFCGKGSTYNPATIFASKPFPVELLWDKHLCFAYRSDKQVSLHLKLKKDSKTHDVYEALPFTENQWSYVCKDMLVIAQKHISNTSTDFMLRQVRVDGSGDQVWVDEVYIGKVPTTKDYERVDLWRIPSPAYFKEVNLAEESANTFSVTFKPFDCGNGYPLLSLQHAEVTSGDVLSSSVSVRVGTWPQDANITITRKEEASPPVTGSFDVEFDGSTFTSIPINASASDLKDYLETLPKLGSVQVTDSATCHSHTWTVTWLSQGGNQPKIQVNSSDLSGRSVVLDVQETDGHLFMNTIAGDFLRTAHDKPQVMAYINGLPTKCSGNCTYEWTQAGTPMLTAISPFSGSSFHGSIVTLNGSGFHPEVSNNSVMIGGLECVVLSASSTQLTCAVGDGPSGTHPVVVSVDGKGLVQHAGSQLTYSYDSDVFSILPLSGSRGGGALLVINGTGFSTNDTVTVGGLPCRIQNITYIEIQCLSPAHINATEVVIIVHQVTGDVVSPVNFTYDASLTPVVTSISHTVASVLGGEELVIKGTELGSINTTRVSVGDSLTTITDISNAHVTLSLPPKPAGKYDLFLEVDGMGFADVLTYSIPSIEYVLRVDSVHPRQGSLEGGTRVTVTGEGFSDVISANVVKIGDDDCLIKHVNSSEIVCMSQSNARIHHVDNMGYHHKYGIGYAWNPANLEVQEGESVRWRWDAPFKISSVRYSVQQTSGAQAMQYDGTGFKSERVKQGQFEFKFNVPGTYYYWSDNVDRSGKIVMRGVVQVNPRRSVTSDLTVLVGQFEAEYNTTLTVSPSMSDNSTSCPPDQALLNNCPTPPPSVNGTKLLFGLRGCLTPRINGVSPTSGSILTDIVITGSGFGSLSCQNKVKVGDYPCIVTSSDNTTITCRVDALNNMLIGQPMPVSVRVDNIGIAMTTLNDLLQQSFVLLPHVDHVSPSSGSLAGGTHLTVNGNGFEGADRVTIDGIDCTIQSHNYTQVVCITQPSLALTGLIAVEVVANGIRIFTNNCSGSCQFSYSQSTTPSITSILPSQITGASSTVTLTGQQLNGTSEDDILITIGGQVCTVTSVVHNELTCTVGYVTAGEQPVSVHYAVRGNAAMGVKTIQVVPEIASVSHTGGSTQGGLLLTVIGGGFSLSDTSVTIGEQPCKIVSLTLAEVQCLTPPGDTQLSNVNVTSNAVSFPITTFNFLEAQTPELSQVSPSGGNMGDSITINGGKLSDVVSDVTVYVGGAVCNVTSSSLTRIVCTLNNHAPGTVPISVNIAGKGDGISQLSFQYSLDIASISPTSGSYGGGQVITLTGSGFTTTATLTVCGAVCDIVSATGTRIECRTPPYTVASNSSSETCDVKVTVGGKTVSSSTSYDYDKTLTPSISSITPKRGGTMGGTSITITGSGFSINQAENSVDVGGSPCNITFSAATAIVCQTEPRRPSIRTHVVVKVAGQGVTPSSYANEFFFVDPWSSPFTWGGNPPPVAGDLVVIPEEEVILLDTSTQVLKLLLIKGSLVFDEVDVELHAESILIDNGGVLQVGTEQEPFQHKATIMLHGHTRSKELPIYGIKNIAVREGTLDLHGRPVTTTWTRLASTATRGSSTITLQVPVEWQIDDEIVIASTGGSTSQSQNEKKRVVAISGDGLTITLDTPLKHTHLGVTKTFTAGISLEKRAEVGLLSHNVVVRGSRDMQWSEDIPACKAGFNTGQFATQTCFQGRFGAEMGSDEYGAHIIIHAPQPDKQLVTARIEYVELTYVGQAFRLGRYPIHFHLNGDMSASYVRGCGIHWSFNRAVNIHHTHNVLIERTVIYNIKGGAFFLEDGIETGNIIQHNLAVFVRPSSSLLNDDITPAAFWVTNPDNIVRHNAAAGGSHFGFWYRMHDHPDGPSFTTSVCPRKVLVQEFFNNTVHSQGWYGLWLFKAYFPMKTGKCNSNTPQAAIFRDLTVWNCRRGAEATLGGAIQFHNMFMVANSESGIEFQAISAGGRLYSDDGPLIINSVIVGTDDGFACTSAGVALPKSAGMKVKNTTFVDFYDNSCAAFKMNHAICSKCAAWDAVFEGLIFINAPNRGVSAWEHEMTLLDLDGTLTGTAGHKILHTSDLLPSSCIDASPAFKNCVKCPPDINLIRTGLNNAKPSSLTYKTINITNVNGNSLLRWKKKGLSHKKGYEGLLVSGYKYRYEFEDSKHNYNLSYNAGFDGFQESDYVIIEHPMRLLPDRVRVINWRSMSPMPLTYTDNVNGDWFYDASQEIFSYISKLSRSGRSISRPSTRNIGVSLSAIRCFYKDCIIPVSLNPEDTPPQRGRPEPFHWWSDTSIWPNNRLPADGDAVEIPFDKWVVVDVELPVMSQLVIRGGLELDGEKDNSTGLFKNFTIETSYLVIIGGRLVIGWEDRPFMGHCEIILNGSLASEEFPGRGQAVGSKVLASFGGLDLHGRNRYPCWTRLSQTANLASNVLHLLEAVDWTAGEEIVLTSTSYDAWQTETFTILSVSADSRQLTLNASLAYKHIGGGDEGIAAEVGLLTRNIRITSKNYPDQERESFGARVLVGRRIENTNQYTGYARIQNVEFFNTGQEGFKEDYDPRFSLAFVGTGTSTTLAPSYVKFSSFHNGFSPAIGLFAANNITVAGNVIHHTVGGGLIVKGDGHKLFNNLITLDIWPGAYLERQEFSNIDFQAAVEAVAASNLELVGNVVAGVERVAYHVYEPCSRGGAASLQLNNVAHSCLSGIVSMHMSAGGCISFSDFFIYKALDYGIYVQASDNVRIGNMKLVDNGVNVLAMVYGPGALSHAYADKSVKVFDSRIVGTSDDFDCVVDIIQTGDDNIKLSSQARSWSNARGRIGISFSSFMSGANMATEKSWKQMSTYPAIGGATYIEGVTFAKFGSRCGNDAAVSTNPGNDDALHPVYASAIVWQDTPLNNRIRYHRPNVGKINPSDCVDMDCDSFKKALVRDMDGTFMGTQGGAIIPKSEFEWGGDQRRGLGNYRIPKAMLTTVDGIRLDADTEFPYKGLVRGNPSSCAWKPSWNAYSCHNLDYQMMVIESLDSDSETRRLSPVALASDGYIDLINGPQDQAWCGEYTCGLRISTFYSLVAMNHNYTMFFTSTNPKKLRLRILNVNDTQAITIAIWYADPRRLDVYYDNQFIFPSNSKLNENGAHSYRSPTYEGEFRPTFDLIPGSNFFDRQTGLLYITVKGPSPIDIITKDVIVLNWSLPPVTVDDFFGENLVANLAAFLDIPPNKIRIVNVVRESSRRKRSVQNMNIQVEIGDEPSNTTSYNDTVTGSLSLPELVNLSSTIISAHQLGKLDAVINTTVLGLSVLEPFPDTTSEQWLSMTSGSASSLEIAVQVPTTLELYVDPVGIQEGSPFSAQPQLRMTDNLGQLVTVMGSALSPWEITAELRLGPTSDPRAVLFGTTTLPFNGGWANFTNLGISHSGGDYIIDFVITYSAETARLFRRTSSELTLSPQQLTASVVDQSRQSEVGQLMNMTVEIQDFLTGSVHHNISWKDHTWECRSSLYMPGLYSSGAVVGGTTLRPFNVTTSQAVYTDLSINIPARYFLQFDIRSQPPTYFITTTSAYVDVWPTGYVAPVKETSHSVSIRFDANYDSVVRGYEVYFGALIYNLYIPKYTDIVMSDIRVTQGSIIVTFLVGGTSQGVDRFLNGMADDINGTLTLNFGNKNVTAVKYMKVDDSFYRGMDGLTEIAKEAPPLITVGGIIGIVVVTFLVVAGVSIFLGLFAHRKLKRVKVFFTTDDGRDMSYDYPPKKFEDQHVVAAPLGKKKIHVSEPSLSSGNASEDEDLDKAVPTPVLLYPPRLKRPLMPLPKTIPMYADVEDLHLSNKSSVESVSESPDKELNPPLPGSARTPFQQLAKEELCTVHCDNEQPDPETPMVSFEEENEFTLIHFASKATTSQQEVETKSSKEDIREAPVVPVINTVAPPEEDMEDVCELVADSGIPRQPDGAQGSEYEVALPGTPERSTRELGNTDFSAFSPVSNKSRKPFVYNTWQD